jgi:hypothetical protein
VGRCDGWIDGGNEGYRVDGSDVGAPDPVGSREGIKDGKLDCVSEGGADNEVAGPLTGTSEGIDESLCWIEYRLGLGERLCEGNTVGAKDGAAAGNTWLGSRWRCASPNGSKRARMTRRATWFVQSTRGHLLLRLPFSSLRLLIE